MASSNLKLIIQKGPRSGDTLEFNSRSTIRIGRLVKGNNLTIKDSGISSKHLEIKFNSDSLSWVIKDLDSCNGTIVNTSQLKPLSQLEICHGDEIKIGELTSIRAEIVEIKENIRRNPRRQVATKSGNDLRGKVEEGLNLGDNVEIKEEIGNHRNPRRRAASKICTNLGGKVEEGSNEEENVEINEEINDRRNPKKQAASKRGHDLGNKVEVPEEGCLNLEEENMEKGVKGNRRGRGNGRTKKLCNLDDASAADELLGVCQNLGNVPIVPMKQECGVSTRRTRSSKRVEEGLVNLVETMPARRTRRAKNVEDVGTSFVMEKVVEGTGSDPDKCKEVESISVVDDKRAQGGRGRKKKVDAESLGNITDAVAEGKMNHVVLEKEHSEKMVDLRGQPCDEPVDDPPEQSVNDETRNEQLMEVDVPEQEGDAVAEMKINHVMFEKEHFEKMVDDPLEQSVNDETRNEQLMEVDVPEQEGDAVAETKINHVMLEKEHFEKMVDLKEQPCDEPVDDPPEHNVNDVMKNKQLMEVEFPEQEADALSMREKHFAELMDETNHVSTQSLEDPRDGVAKDKMNHEVFENEVSDKMVDLREQPCVEPVHDARGKSVADDAKNEQFMDVEVPEQEGGALSMREKQCEDLIGEANQQHDCVSLPVSEQHFAELMEETNQQDNCVSLSMSEQRYDELMDEPTKCEDCVVGSSVFEGGVSDGVGSDAVFDYGRTEESEIEGIDKESEANCYGRCKDPETADVADLENMTLSDWFDFLETYLPKQIYAATDKIVEDMQKRSVQFDEYMLQHQREKSNTALSTEKVRS